MSRIGKLPITLPQGVQVTWKDPELEVKGPKGALKRRLHAAVTAQVEGGSLKVVPRDPSDPSSKPFWGLSRSLAANMVTGVSAGFSKTLEVQGVGWKIEEEGPRALRLSLGFSHPVIHALPEGVEAKVDTKAGRVSLSSVDNELLGQTCATIRAYRPPEPYKGKGIRYMGEVIRRKVGKAGSK
ncbi:MAG: 50S ribosomal protein L6 [Deltaproteobacteria bacterium]|jgi:large subunit ribosomal protein L6|nr:50S ribosomal protein L6 [Deltaproteobacteria bacterium]